MKYKLAALGGILLLQAHAWAWGCKGHQTVTLIAMAHLDPAVAAKVDAILAASPISDSQRRGCAVAGLPLIANVSTWADDSHEPGTSPDHYIDIPMAATRAGFDINKLCNDNCVTWAIVHFTQQLKTSTDPGERAKALRYIIHFVGDIHQPLHDIDNADRGGNCVPAKLPGATQESNLHSLWDSGILGVISPGNDAIAFAKQLDAQYGANPAAASDNPVDWAWQGHALAVKNVYAPLPVRIAVDTEPAPKACSDRVQKDPEENITPDYISQATPVIEGQLDAAGLRLARLLNHALGD